MENRFAGEAAVDETVRAEIEAGRRRLEVVALAYRLAAELWEALAPALPWLRVVQAGNDVVVGRAGLQLGVIVHVTDDQFEVGFKSEGRRVESFGKGSISGEVVFVEAAMLRLLKAGAERLRDVAAKAAP